MRPYLTAVLLVIWMVNLTSCRKDFEYAPSNGNLGFSKDTVFLDTVFSNIGSGTYTLKVYNRTKDDIAVPRIGLARGENSGYRLNVDGVAGKEFADVPLMAKDSLFIFIETTFDASNTETNEFLYTDILQFGSGDGLQEVQLVTLIKDALFLFPPESGALQETITLQWDANGPRIEREGFKLTDDQLRFTNGKPYVIYGYMVVPEQKTLTVDQGARIHFHRNSGIYVNPGASLQIDGDLSSDLEVLENEVIFEGDRLEPDFENSPGQWGGIWLASGSINHTINHLTLKNATVGIYVEGNGTLLSPSLTIKNTQIYNSSSINLWAKTASVKAENIVLGSAGKSSLYCHLGGDYSFVHTTMANYWTESFRSRSALEIDNTLIDTNGNETIADLTKADFINCIVDGNNSFELSLRSGDTGIFEYSFQNCTLTFDESSGQLDEKGLYDFQNPLRYDQVLLNEEVGFKNSTQNDFRLNDASPAIDKGNVEAAQGVPVDILGIDRISAPDIGAYEFVPEN